MFQSPVVHISIFFHSFVSSVFSILSLLNGPVNGSTTSLSPYIRRRDLGLMQVYVPAACERRATDELELRAGVAMLLSLRIMLSPRVAVMRLLALLMHQRLGPECSSCLGERKKERKMRGRIHDACDDNRPRGLM